MILHWIPVEEQLPEASYMCLVSCKTKKGIQSVNRAYYDNGFWHGSGSMSGVEAWMPLPAPYRKDESKTQNSNLTFEKDECAKEYEELGLKELKELIKADCAWK